MMGAETPNQAPAEQEGEPLPVPPGHSAYSTLKPSGKKRQGPVRFVLELIAIAIAAGLIAYFVQLLLVKPFEIPSGSMENTLKIGDRVLVNRLAYRFGSPSRGDVIVFKSPQNLDEDLIKRVVAVGGDTVEIRSGNLLVDGQIQVEPYIKEPMRTTNFGPVRVPDGNLFVMGDNRNDSFDSRMWNPHWLPVENVVGKAFMIYWPLNRLSWLG